MRLRVVHDEDGRILAAAVVPEADDDSPKITPVAGHRQIAAEVEVPQEVADQNLDVICTRMRVDIRNNRLASVDEAS
jgi:hypothetical protein